MFFALGESASSFQLLGRSSLAVCFNPGGCRYYYLPDTKSFLTYFIYEIIIWVGIRSEYGGNIKYDFFSKIICMEHKIANS